MSTHNAAALDEQLEDLASVEQQALGQRDAVIEHTDEAFVLFASLRLAAEQLLAAHYRALTTLDRVPAFSADLPDEQVGQYADLDLSSVARRLLGTFNADKLADLQAGIDSAEGAIRRYRQRVETAYETTYGDPVGWRPAAQISASRNVLAMLRDECPVKGCDEKGAHAAVLVNHDSGVTRHVGEPAGGAEWDPNEVVRGVDL